METLSAIFNLTENDLCGVEINVDSRLDNLEIRLSVDEFLQLEDCIPVERFYEKVLAHRRKRFNQKHTTRNLHLLRQAIYAQCYLNKKLDALRMRKIQKRVY